MIREKDMVRLGVLLRRSVDAQKEINTILDKITTEEQWNEVRLVMQKQLMVSAALLLKLAGVPVN